MCGIFLSIASCNDNNDVHFWKQFEISLFKRGPDAKDKISIDYKECIGEFIGYVLWTQGSKPTKQPLVDEKGNILLWNGDIFDGKFVPDAGECDSENILKLLSLESNNLLSCFSQIIGPYAFIYWDNRTRCLWFGRDVVGRHSLLWELKSDYLIISSVANKLAKNIVEVPAQGLFMLDFKNGFHNLEMKFFPWRHCHGEYKFDLSIPFSIGDSVTHEIIGNGEIPENICNNEDILSLEDVEFLNKVCSQYSKACDIFKACLENKEIKDKVLSFTNLLKKSIEVRVGKQPGVCRKCVEKNNCSHSKTGILFSGGLDCSVIALIADKYVPKDEPIDLFNVAFENPSKKIINYNVPDRKTGESSVEELRNLCPGRKWNFVKIDISNKELQKLRNEHISHLIHPLNTILDDSLGCALWFAARGIGTLDIGDKYESPVRVVLLGMGADEMLGGYMRNRTLWRRERSWISLAKSLANDMAIIGCRNLGRDNRVVADHGCQPRLPYLDERVIAFIQSLPPWKRCYLCDKMPSGIGDKLLLRLVAWNLGLHKVSAYPKRAMQFGSRIANSSENGNNISNRL